jgi:hypothetical protein
MASDDALDEADEDDGDGQDFDPEKNRLAEPLRSILIRPDHLSLLRLSPFRRRRDVMDRRYFHSWRVKRRRRIDGRADRLAVLAAIERGLAESDGTTATCFDPTVGVHARRGGDPIDLVCCFDCNWIRVRAVVGGQAIGGTLLTSLSPLNELSSLLDRRPGVAP